MKRYAVPVTYTMEVYLYVEADSSDDAVDIASGMDFNADDGEYVQDTIEIHEPELITTPQGILS